MHEAQRYPCGVLKNIHPRDGKGISLTKKRSKNITHTIQLLLWIRSNNITHTIQLLLCIKTMVGSIDHDGYYMVYLCRDPRGLHVVSTTR
jgi:hypothetical protein